MTVGSETITYTLDVAAPLVQVLVANEDGAHTAYLYGVVRIAENDGAWQYYLTDHLGSVRSLVDAEGSVAGTRAYQPYGAPLSSAGVAESVYGFTGEQMDPTGLVYLRARMYAPGLELFLSEDPWPGRYDQPISLNGFAWVQANPINRIDPSGLLSNRTIASSFGEFDFDEVLRVFEDNGHWGFLAALQDAAIGDLITVGVEGNAREMPSFRVQCRDGVVFLEEEIHSFYLKQPMTLAAFQGAVLEDTLLMPEWVRQAALINGDFIPTWRVPQGWGWFFVNGSGGRDGKGYPDHTKHAWLPDFKSLIPGGGFDVGPIGVGAHWLVDRYGNKYQVGNVGWGLGFGIGVYLEGYVTTNGRAGANEIPSEDELTEIMEGFDFGADCSFGGGIGDFASGLGRGGVIFSVGFQVGCSAGGSRTWPLGKDPKLAWDWIERVQGYQFRDIRLDESGEIGACNECSGY